MGIIMLINTLLHEVAVRNQWSNDLETVKRWTYYLFTSGEVPGQTVWLIPYRIFSAPFILNRTPAFSCVCQQASPSCSLSEWTMSFTIAWFLFAFHLQETRICILGTLGKLLNNSVLFGESDFNWGRYFHMCHLHAVVRFILLDMFLMSCHHSNVVNSFSFSTEWSFKKYF